jgi:hypothetical protein
VAVTLGPLTLQVPLIVLDQGSALGLPLELAFDLPQLAGTAIDGICQGDRHKEGHVLAAYPPSNCRNSVTSSMSSLELLRTHTGTVPGQGSAGQGLVKKHPGAAYAADSHHGLSASAKVTQSRSAAFYKDLNAFCKRAPGNGECDDELWHDGPGLDQQERGVRAPLGKAGARASAPGPAGSAARSDCGSDCAALADQQSMGLPSVTRTMASLAGHNRERPNLRSGLGLDRSCSGPGPQGYGRGSSPRGRPCALPMAAPLTGRGGGEQEEEDQYAERVMANLEELLSEVGPSHGLHTTGSSTAADAPPRHSRAAAAATAAAGQHQPDAGPAKAYQWRDTQRKDT